MTRTKKIAQYRPNLKLFDEPRNRVIFSRNLSGDSYTKLSRIYNLSAARIGQICKQYRKWISAGYLKPVQVYED